jgi:hypothetical protein
MLDRTLLQVQTLLGGKSHSVPDGGSSGDDKDFACASIYLSRIKIIIYYITVRMTLFYHAINL